VDALCVATLSTEEAVPEPRENIYQIGFRPRQVRRQYRSLPRKGQGRVRYQVHEELEGFRKGDISDGRLAFKRAKGEPSTAHPKDCRLLESGCTVIWQGVV
jgi:hypothetical protein